MTNLGNHNVWKTNKGKNLHNDVITVVEFHGEAGKFQKCFHPKNIIHILRDLLIEGC